MWIIKTLFVFLLFLTAVVMYIWSPFDFWTYNKLICILLYILNNTKFKESYERTLKLIKPLEILWLVSTRIRTRVVIYDSCSVVFWLVFIPVRTRVVFYDSCWVVFWLVFTRVRTRVLFYDSCSVVFWLVFGLVFGLVCCFMTRVQSCSESCSLVFGLVCCFMTRVQSCTDSCSVVFGVVLSFREDPDEPFKTSLLPQFYRKVA